MIISVRQKASASIRCIISTTGVVGVWVVVVVCTVLVGGIDITQRFTIGN